MFDLFFQVKELEEFGRYSGKVTTEQISNEKSPLIRAQQKSDEDDKKEEETPSICDCGCKVM